MKRFLFLFCGAALAIIAGGRCLILLADHVFSPHRLAATAIIQFPKEAEFDMNSVSLSSEHFVKVVETERFRQQLSDALNLGVSPNAKEVQELVERNFILRSDISNRMIHLTCLGWNEQELISMAGTLATAWSQATYPQPSVRFPVSAVTLDKDYLPLFSSWHMIIPLVLSLLGVVMFGVGWRMPRTIINTMPLPVVVDPKY